MLSREEAIEIIDNMDSAYCPTKEEIQSLKHYINQPITLDKDIEKAIECLKGYKLTGRGYNALNTIKQHILAQASEIDNKEQTILKMLDVVCKNDTIESNLIRLEFMKIFEDNVEKEQIIGEIK